MSTDRPATTDQQPKVYGAEGTTEPRVCSCGQIDCHRMWTPTDDTAARAPEAPGDAQSPTPDVGAAQGGDYGSAAESEPRVHYEVEMYNDGWSIPIYRTDSVDDARAHEEPAVTSASTRIVRVTREVIT